MNLRFWWLIVILAGFAAAQGGASTHRAEGRSPAASRPNIVLFMVDDLGWNDNAVDFGLAKVAGINAHYRTPALQRLAASGTRFREAYAHPVCTPSRASLLTGLGTIRHGITDWTLQRGKDLKARRGPLQLPDWNCNGLQPAGCDLPHTFESDQTLPMLLARAGWRTIHVGKAHFGALDTPGADPLKLGFDVNVAGHAAGGAASHLGRKNFAQADAKKDQVWNVPGLSEWHGKDVTLAEALTDAALREVDKAVATQTPFFLHLSHYGVHVPIEPATKFAAHYADSGLSQREQQYAQMVEDVDASLGRVLDALERHHIAEQTVVIFLSDNGGFGMRGGPTKAINAPLRGAKGSCYEGGVRTPLVVRWPGVSRADALSTAVARIEDLLPTCLDVAALAIPANLDGVSLRAPLRGEPQSARELHWYYPHNWGGAQSGSEPAAALRLGSMKLLHFFEGPRVELYDLGTDPGETTDLAAAQPELAQTLDARLLAAIAAAGRPLPTPAIR